ncbi:MAG: hypothetical protein WDM90_12045 [Ferruginibacter sp.]
MKQFKIIDFWISIGLVIFFTIINLTVTSYAHFFNEYFFSVYFIVGVWQVISMIIHAYNHWFTNRDGRRYTYHWIIAIAIITAPIGSAWLLLFAAPFMVVFYAWLCYEEIYVKMKRPLSVLK